jgi:SpoIID/LytB domain protein
MHSWRLLRRAEPITLVLVLLGSVLVTNARTTRDADDVVAAEPAVVHEQDVPRAPAATKEPAAPTRTAAPTVVAELPETTVRSFSMLGVTWDPDDRSADLAVDVKWRHDGRWSSWTPLDLELGPDVEGGRPGTEPQWTDASDGVAVRVTSTTGHEPSGLRVAMIDPGATPDVRPVAATVAQPPIIMRSQWGASAGGSCSSPIYGATTLGAVIHHTAGSNSYTKAQSAGIVKATQAYHVNSRDWCDIGYNFLVDKYGQIFEGRKGGITKPVRAAHSGNDAVNQQTMGVSLMGTFSSTEPTAAMKSSVAHLVAWRFAQYNRPAKGTYSLGGKTLNRIAGHRNVVSTECPGAKAYAWLSAGGGLRDAVEDRLTNTSSTPKTEIGKLAAALGSSRTGAVVDPEWGNDTQRRANYTKMDITWKQGIGAFYVYSYFRDEWNRLKSHNGPLGFPTAQQVMTSNKAVAVQRFENGTVYRVKGSDGYAAYGVSGPMEDTYRNAGEITSKLGIPRSATYQARTGFQRTKFTKGYLELNQATGKVTAHYAGTTETPTEQSEIAKNAAALGPAVTGAPVGEERGNTTQRRRDFEKMDITWKQGVGTFYVYSYFRDEWNRLGSTRGPLRFPTAKQVMTSNKAVGLQRFERGTVYRVKGTDGYKAYGVYGPMEDTYRDLGEVTGRLGVPRSASYQARTGFQRTKFTKGYLELNESTGKVTAYYSAASTSGNTVTIPSTRSVKLAGHGYGHGIGMSQYGAQGAAVQGKSYSQILDYYYPGTAISTKRTNIRVLISAATSSTVTVKAQSGLRFRYTKTDKTIDLPATRGGATVSQWRIIPLVADPRQSVLQYRTDAWHAYDRNFWVGDAQFEAVGGKITLVLPGGTTRQYRSIIRSAVPSTGATNRKTINITNIDNYTLGVVAAEVPSSWDADALKAQAIAARTYGIRSVHSGGYYDICDTTACQVYRGVSGETSATNAASVATNSMILTYGGDPAFTQFSSSSGGVSAAGSQPYLKAKVDAYDNWSSNPNHSWSKTISASTLEKAYPSIGTLRSMTISKRSGIVEWGGRVLTLTLTGSKSSTSITGPRARTVLGLRSDYFKFA